MYKFWNSRFFRILICLILVCCILVNASPIKAKAVTPIALTGWAILALTAALGAGVVWNPATPQVANAIGEELNKTAQRVAPDGWDTIAKVCDHLDNMVPEWDPGDYHNDLKTALAGGLLTAITAMIVAAVSDGVVNAEVKEEAEEGNHYYGSESLPDISSISQYFPSCSVHVIYSSRNNDSLYLMLIEPGNDFSLGLKESGYFMAFNGIRARRYILKESVWSSDSSFGAFGEYNFGIPEVQCDILWTNMDVLGSDGSLYFPSSDPSSTSTTTVPVVPEIYVGDIPQKIQDGEDDPEKLNIPPIDPSRFVTSPDTAFEEITKVGQDIKNGTTTYNEFVTNNQFQQPTPSPDNPDPSTPGDSSDPDETTPDETQPEEEKPVEDLGNFTLDLSDYFPFCIPFDLYDFFACLAASPEAPVIHWEIVGPGGSLHELNLDLSPYDSVAQLLRRLQLLLFCVGLAFKTRDLIKG